MIIQASPYPPGTLPSPSPHPTQSPSCLTHTNLDLGCITHSAMHYSTPHAPHVSLIIIDDTSNPSPSPYPPGAPNFSPSPLRTSHPTPILSHPYKPRSRLYQS